MLAMLVAKAVVIEVSGKVLKRAEPDSRFRRQDVMIKLTNEERWLEVAQLDAWTGGAWRLARGEGERCHAAG